MSSPLQSHGWSLCDWLRAGCGVVAAALGEMNPPPQQQLVSVHIQQTTSPTWDAPGSFEGFGGGYDPAGLTLPC